MTQFIINTMASSRLFVFLLVFGGHFLLILIAILTNPIKEFTSTDTQKITLQFVSRIEKTTTQDITRATLATFEPKSPEIKKKRKLSKKKKIKKKLPELSKKINELEPVVGTQEKINKNDFSEEKPADSFKELKPFNNNYSNSKDMSMREIKTRARIGSDISQCKPNYPRTSKRRGEQGTVILRFLINEEGKAEKAEIKQTSGYKRLDNAAKAGLSSCKFIPASVNGVFIKDWAVIPYVFQLK